jgi:1-aminocyclopropane-1-carboxylate deaminase
MTTPSLTTLSPLQRLTDPFPEKVAINLWLKRDDLLHPQVSGNKWRKLKYNLVAARDAGFDTLLTFGGAFSNHLYATAASGQINGLKTIGVVRGDELAKQPLNPTLTFCQEAGMTLHFVSRADYSRKEDPHYLADLQAKFGLFYLLPEGGTNALALQGTAEILPEIVAELGFWPDAVACSVGTGGTVLGLTQSAKNSDLAPKTQILGFLALKTQHFMLPTIDNCSLITDYCSLITDYHFGGYARTTPELLRFMHDFETRTGILIEQVYTAKMLFGIYDLARRGYFSPAATVVAVHTGGLQGRIFQPFTDISALSKKTR